MFAFLFAACTTHDEVNDARDRQRDSVMLRSTAIRAQIGDDPGAALGEAYALHEQVGALQDSVSQQLALRTLGRALNAFGRRDSARLCSIAALRAARGNDDPKALADALILHALVLNTDGTRDSSVMLLEEATGHARRAGDSLMLAAAHGNLANAHSLRGDMKSAVAHYLIARDLYERLGAMGPLASAHRNLAGEYAAMGVMHAQSPATSRPSPCTRGAPGAATSRTRSPTSAT